MWIKYKDVVIAETTNGVTKRNNDLNWLINFSAVTNSEYFLLTEEYGDTQDRFGLYTYSNQPIFSIYAGIKCTNLELYKDFVVVNDIGEEIRLNDLLVILLSMGEIDGSYSAENPVYNIKSLNIEVKEICKAFNSIEFIIHIGQ